MIDILFRGKCIHCSLDLNDSDSLHLCPLCRSELDARISAEGWNALVSDRLKHIPQISRAHTLTTMSGNDVVHTLIYHLKYRGLDGLGTELGKIFGHLLPLELKENDVLIPVPIHWYKKIKRGFNQAEKIALGIREIFPKATISQSIKRSNFSKTQASLGRLARFKNVKDIFYSVEISELRNKDLWIVDDVITTGTTMGNMLKAIDCTKVNSINVLSIAITV